MGCLRRADTDFGMIQDGDRIAVGVSGGKDSLALVYCLELYKRFSKKNYEIYAVTVDTGLRPFDLSGVREFMARLGVPYEVKVASAHRKPAVVHEWAETAHDRGIKVIIAAAGKAAHLGGVVAAFTPLPVIAVPMKTSDLGGLDSLLSMVQMPSGVPVACVAINGAKNAAILAVQMMGTGDATMLQKVADLKAEMAS